MPNTPIEDAPCCVSQNDLAAIPEACLEASSDTADDPDSFAALLAAAVAPLGDHEVPEREATKFERLPRGEQIDGRFVVEEYAGEGGMGVVYRCLDSNDDSVVALKVIHNRQQFAGRFRREVAILSAVHHPAIVRYVAHGQTDSGRPYLAMEWLDGEDLARCLQRGPLSVEHTVTLTRRLCEGLAVAHAMGFVHRDIKPSNVFIPNGHVASAKLLDFGLARRDGATQTLTRAGTVLGTPGYMAPEQAMGKAIRDPRTDLFSLGCVLFECLTGRPAFSGESYAEVLEKVLRGDVPRLSELCPELAPELEQLATRLLARELERRPSDAGEVARSLRLMEADMATALACDQGHRDRSAPWLGTVVLVDTNHCAVLNTRLVRELEVRASSFGLRRVSASDPVVLWVSSDETLAVADRAARATLCARAFKRDRPELIISVGTGLLEAESALGAAFDSATALRGAAASTSNGVALDELTLILIEGRLMARRLHPLSHVITELTEPDLHRLAGGLDAPCVGREREMSFLESTLNECAGERSARAVLVLGSSGIGKSLLAQLFALHASRVAGALTVMVRADPAARNEPQSFLRTLVRAASPPSGFESVLESSEGSSPSCIGPETPGQAQRRATKAFSALVAQLCACAPLVLLLDDAHHIDLASLQCLAAAFRELADRPLLIVGFVHPELPEHVRTTWLDLAPQELCLRGLSGRAAEQLITQALGDSARSEDVKLVSELGEGNPRLLRALARSFGHRSGAPSPAPIGLIQAELLRLASEVRTALCAASVFGDRFWLAGVEAIVGDAAKVGQSLHVLAERGHIVRQPESRFCSSKEYAFRHSLLRDAAYALLHPSERQSAHRLASRWLESQGETDGELLRRHRAVAVEVSNTQRPL